MAQSALLFPPPVQLVVLAVDTHDNSLRQVTGTPRMFLSIANRPLLHHILDFVANSGFEEVVVVSTETDSVPRFLARHPWTPPSGALALNMLHHLVDERFAAASHGLVCDVVSAGLVTAPRVLVCKADFVTNLCLHEILDSTGIHEGAQVMVATHNIMPNAEKLDRKVVLEQFGDIFVHHGQHVYDVVPGRTVKPDGKFSINPTLLTRFPEVSVDSSLTDAHLYLLDTDLFREAREGVYSIRRDLIPDLAHRGSLVSYVVPRQKYLYRILHTDSLRRVIVDVSKSGGGVSGDSEVPATVRMKNCVVGDGCTLGSGSTIFGSILFDGVTVGNDCKINNSILFSRAEVKPGLNVQDCILGADSTLRNDARDVRLDRGSVM